MTTFSASRLSRTSALTTLEKLLCHPLQTCMCLAHFFCRGRRARRVAGRSSMFGGLAPIPADETRSSLCKQCGTRRRCVRHGATATSSDFQRGKKQPTGSTRTSLPRRYRDGETLTERSWWSPGQNMHAATRARSTGVVPKC
jgi:hypothetical protein